MTKDHQGYTPNKDLFDENTLPETFHEWIVNMDYLELLDFKDETINFSSPDLELSESFNEKLNIVIFYFLKETGLKLITDEIFTHIYEKLVISLTFEDMIKKKWATSTGRHYVSMIEHPDELYLDGTTERGKEVLAAQNKD